MEEKRGVFYFLFSSIFSIFTEVNNQKTNDMKEKIESQEEEKFRVKAYTKAELAALYNPGLAPILALQKLYRWMHKCRPLCEALQQVGYNKYRHSFLKQEVGLIVKYLGEP